MSERARLRAFGFALQNNAAVAAFNAWCEARLLWRRHSRVMRRLKRGSLGRAWNTWLDFVVALAAAHRLLGRCTRRWRRSGLSRAVRVWLEMADEQQRSLAMLHHAIARMANLKLAQIVDAWTKAVAKAKLSRRELQRKAINLMRAPLLTHTFYAWKRLRERASNAEAKMRTAILMWSRRLLIQAFMSWDEVIGSGRALRRKAVARFVDRLKTRAFAAWVAEVERQRTVFARLRETRNRWANRVVVLCFHAWRDDVQRKRDLISSAVGRWSHAAIVRGWDRWKEVALEGARLMRIGRRVIQRHVSALLSRCFDGWVRLALSETSRRGVLQRASLQKLSGRPDMFKEAVLMAWHEVAVASGQRRAELARKFRGRFLQKMLAKCFLAWQGWHLREGSRKGNKLLVALGFLAQRQDVLKRIILTKWQQYTIDTKQRREEVVRFALTRMQKGMMHVCFLGWLKICPRLHKQRLLEAEPDSEKIQRLEGEAATLRAQLADLAKQVATHERSKAYR